MDMVIRERVAGWMGETIQQAIRRGELPRWIRVSSS